MQEMKCLTHVPPPPPGPKLKRKLRPCSLQGFSSPTVSLQSAAPPADSLRDNTWLWRHPACLHIADELQRRRLPDTTPSTSCGWLPACLTARWKRYGRADPGRSSVFPAFPRWRSERGCDSPVPSLCRCPCSRPRPRQRSTSAPRTAQPETRSGRGSRSSSRSCRPCSCSWPSPSSTGTSAETDRSSCCCTSCSSDPSSGQWGGGLVYPSFSHGWSVQKRWIPSWSWSPPSNVYYPPQVSSPVMVFLVKNSEARPHISCLLLVWWTRCAHAVVFVFSGLLSLTGCWQAAAICMCVI